jgi:hypothetical protein
MATSKVQKADIVWSELQVEKAHIVWPYAADQVIGQSIKYV